MRNYPGSHEDWEYQAGDSDDVGCHECGKRLDESRARYDDVGENYYCKHCWGWFCKEMEGLNQEEE